VVYVGGAVNGAAPTLDGFGIDGSNGRIELTHVNLNDGVVEGLRVTGARAFSVQYHPEAGPGPHDARYLFEEFKDLMVRAKAR